MRFIQMLSLEDIQTLKLADADSSNSPRGLWRIGRRIANRCWRDHETINQPRVFCQNGGACGSTYVVHLLNVNRIERSFHEKAPDLLQIGLDHYEKPIPTGRLARLLRYTRHDAFFEANNRLFSMTCQIADAFPKARFIHLHRDGTEVVRSGMSKQNVTEYVKSNTRFRGTLAGPHHCDLFTRFCHHWANMNRRIHTDLKSVSEFDFEVVDLRFEDMVKGQIQPLEDSLGRSLKQKISQPVNVRPVRTGGKFPKYSEWTNEQQQTFDQICGPVMSLLGR